MEGQLREERGAVCGLEADEIESGEEVEELWRLVAAGGGTRCLKKLIVREFRVQVELTHLNIKKDISIACD